VIDKIANAINNSISRVTGLRPVEITPKNAEMLWERVYEKYMPDVNNNKPSKKNNFLENGETVRISRYKKVFEKGYFPNWSDQIFKVADVHRSNPLYYHVKDFEVYCF